MSQLPRRGRRPASMFGPIVLIAIGLFLLFNHLYPDTRLYWLDTLRLWPLLLVFLGLNVIVLQAPRPFASLLSGFLSLLVVVVFGYVLFNGLAGTPLDRFDPADWQSEPIHFGPADVETAVYEITVDAPGADIYALEDSRDLLAGTITYQDEYSFDTRVVNGEATISLAPEHSNSRDWFSLFARWRDYDEIDRSRLGLSPTVPADLTVTAVAGRSHFDLRDLLLESLTLGVNAGEAELLLPAGNYDAHLTTNAGTFEITLPDSGRQTIDVAVNAGSVTLHSPANVALRVEVDRALGAFNASDAGLRRVAGRENVWETADYARADSRLDLRLHISVGSVTID